MSEVSFVVEQAGLDVIKNTHISANFDECKAALVDMIAPYKGMIVSEDAIAEAKSDRAKIRKVAQRIDDARKTVKKVYTEPLALFEADCKELIEICMEGVNNLDTQVKAFEQAEKDAKIAELRAFYDEVSSDEEKAYCPWESIYNPKWENKGYVIGQAQGEIHDVLMRTEADLESIRTMGGEDVPYLLDYYRHTRDIGAVIRKSAELKTAREREAQRKREAEERQRAVESERERQRAEADAEAKRESAVVQKQPVQEPEYAPAVTTDLEQDELVTVDFRVCCTKAQLSALGQYMRANGIKYGRAS